MERFEKIKRFDRFIYTLAAGFVLTLLTSCSLNPLEIETGRFLISIESGDNWLHDFPLLGPITKKNPPTFALWITDDSDTYIDTIFVSKKIGESSWISSDDNRPEALPLWSYVRGGQPTEDNPAPDGVTGATPKVSSTYLVTPGPGLSRFKIWLEVNHSIDYNSFFPSGIDDESASNFSGGEGGSGQPALVYTSATIDMSDDSGAVVELVLNGHSEPGGAKTGTVYADLSEMTSAVEIIGNVKVKIP